MSRYISSYMAIIHQCFFGLSTEQKVLWSYYGWHVLFTWDRESHNGKLEDLPKALLKKGLNISLKKCQWFKKQLQYMGKTIFVKGMRVCVKPMRIRIEAIQRLRHPIKPKGCRGFAGVVNFWSLSWAAKTIKTYIWPNKKGKVFHWGTEQQKTFVEIKRQLQNPPVLYMSDSNGRFHLYSDTSEFTTGRALYQIRNGQPWLIAYASKRMQTAPNYSITKLELRKLAKIFKVFLTC